MKSIKNVSTVALTLLVGGLTVSTQALAVTPCSGNDFLSGNYGAQFSGTVTTGLAGGIGGSNGRTGNVAGFATTSGRFTLDGFGKVIGTVSSNTNGAFLQGSVVGTYSVKYLDCTVTIALTDGAGGVQHFDGIIAARGDTVLLIQSDRGAGLSGSMQRSRSSCDNSNMNRSYAFHRNGNTAYTSATDGSDALTSIGLLTADGMGNFSMTESMFREGVFSRTVSSGTYSVSSDCSVVLRVRSTTAVGSATMLQGQLVNSDTELLWIQADNGSSVTGAFSAQ
jgi:hypothetical protein